MSNNYYSDNNNKINKNSRITSVMEKPMDSIDLFTNINKKKQDKSNDWIFKQDLYNNKLMNNTDYYKYEIPENLSTEGTFQHIEDNYTEYMAGVDLSTRDSLRSEKNENNVVMLMNVTREMEKNMKQLSQNMEQMRLTYENEINQLKLENENIKKNQILFLECNKKVMQQNKQILLLKDNKESE